MSTSMLRTAVYLRPISLGDRRLLVCCIALIICPIKIIQFSVRIDVPNAAFVLDLWNFGDPLRYFRLFEIFWTAGSFLVK